jgi:orotidine-5'-phosphate decarboxylase
MKSSIILSIMLKGGVNIFIDKLIEHIKAKETPCIVGLDPNINLMPEFFLNNHNFNEESSLAERAELLFNYNKMVIDQTYDLVAAVKPQAAYYEKYGSAGFAALEQTIEYAKEKGLFVILDAKRGDIGSTSKSYAEAYLAITPKRSFECDSMTLSPYLGEDGLEPFYEIAKRDGKGIFICVRNSNSGAGIIQNFSNNGKAVYNLVSEFVGRWSDETLGKYGYSAVGAVVGATTPVEARELRRILPKSLFLVPGYGAQGGSAEGVRACFNDDGLGAVVNSSRAVMYPKDMVSEKDVRIAAETFVSDIRRAMN